MAHLTDRSRSALREIARKMLRRLRALRPRKHPSHRLLRQEEAEAMRAVLHNAGRDAQLAIVQGLRHAEHYRRWDGWSLPRPAIVWVAEKIAAERLAHVVEFGAGYSSVALAEFLRRVAPATVLDSYEHQEVFAEALRKRLPSGGQVRLHAAPLLQVDDERFAALLSGAAPAAQFRSAGRSVSPEALENTRLRNAFYDLGATGVPGPPVDLVILDGPHGNGRSLAYPLLADRLAIPCWLVLDDYDHYPFLDDLGKLFEFEEVQRLNMEQVRTILVRITQRKAAPR
jgi:hypothetical protein